MWASLLPLTLVLLGGCAPDPWSATREACGLVDGEVVPWSAVDREDGAWNSLVVDGRCAEELLLDIHAHPDVLLETFEGGSDLGAYVEDARTGEEPVDGLPVTIWGLFWLLGGDFGTVGALEAGPYVDPKWAELVEDAAAARGLESDAPLSQVLYDLVSTRIRGIDLLPVELGPASSGLGSADSVLYIPRTISTEVAYLEDPYAASVSAYVLAHESEHGVEGSEPHVSCGDWPAPACDVDLTGAQGFEVAVRWAQVLALVDGAGCLDAEDPDHARALELEFAIQERFASFILTDAPEPLLTRCE